MEDPLPRHLRVVRVGHSPGPVIPLPVVDVITGRAYNAGRKEHSMATWTCERCGTVFKRDAQGSRRIRFCGTDCYHEWQKSNPNSGTFSKGSAPWNKGKRGIHISPRTEFKRGQTPVNRCSVGTVRIRQRRHRAEGPRAWVKVAEPNVWKLRARIVWEDAHGPISRGLIVHHVDEDTLNDSLSNLSVVDRAGHAAEHGRRRGGLNKKKRSSKKSSCV